MQAIGGVAEEATLHLNIAVVLQRMGRIEEVITHVEQGCALLVKYRLPQSAGGGTLAQYDALLAQLRGEEPPASSQSTLPQETINTLAGNTVAVKTNVPDMRDEWYSALQGAQADWASKGDDWAIEVAFVEALLAIMDDAPASLPPDNPYASVVAQVIEAIDGYSEE